MAIDRYTVEERYTKRTLKRGFTVSLRLAKETFRIGRFGRSCLG